MKLEEIVELLQNKVSLTLNDSFDIAKQCKIYLNDKGLVGNGRKIIVHVLDNWKKIPSTTYEIWTDLIELAGFYPYLEKEKDKLEFNNLSAELRKELHTSKNILNDTPIYFHEEQKILNNILNSGKNLIVSAPTSFGKSLLIEELVASFKYKNIVVIQPTLALLDETRKKLKKYRHHYKTIVKTSQKPSEKSSNLFLLTSERVLEYKDFENVDFLVIDEFYKLSTARDDERAEHLNNAFYKLLKSFSPQFYLLGPNIKDISYGFKEKFNAEFYKTDYSLIDNYTHDLYTENKEIFDKANRDSVAQEYKEKILFDLLYEELSFDQSIIYCKSPEQVMKLASRFSKYLQEKEVNVSNNLPIIEWIKLNINEKWKLINFLEYQIGINNGGIPKHINSSIVNYFNENKLKYLFCTTTLIEGVNTSAKNMIIFDNIKGRYKQIDFFDHSNIKGRSGRMMVHYIGNIYDFNEPPKVEDIIVDIPFYEQPANSKQFPAEIEIAIETEDIKNKETEQYKKLQTIEPELRKIIKNNGLLVEGQLKIIEEISDLEKEVTIERKKTKYKQSYKLHDLLNWSYPEYDQLQYIFELCWKYLKKPSESLSIYTVGHLTFKVNDYSKEKKISSMIDKTYENYKEAREKQSEKWHRKYLGKKDEELLNEAIQDTFQIFRHWFQYKVPKWLGVINSLQNYICKKNNLNSGNYLRYASQLENDFLDENLSIFLEYGIPKSAINKLKKYLREDLTEDEIIKIAKQRARTKDSELLEYEKDKIIESI